MLSKKEIKDIQSLRYKKQRDDSGIFLAEGPKVVNELLHILPQNIIKIYGTKEWLKSCPTTFTDKIEEITDIELEKLSGLQTPNEVIALFKQNESKEPQLLPTDYCLYLDTVQDPGNFGTIVRIGDWFGIKHIVCTTGCADAYNPKVVQASMGSLGRVHFYYDKDMEWIKQQNTNIYAATLNGKSLYTFEKNRGGVLLIGNESKGVSTELLALATEEVTIPRIGGAESLNAAVATGIILSHLIN